MKRAAPLATLALVLVVAGCGQAPPPPSKQLPGTATAATTASAAVAGPDLLGQKPALGPATPFEPPAPQVIKAPNGMTVWLLERHTVPMVAVTLAVPVGASADPRGKAGLAYITASMLDEGAGARDAVELSTAVVDLGATLVTGASADGSFAGITVLKKNFGPAFSILADVVARPRFEPKEWKRVSELWKNDLEERAQDPVAVSRVVTSAVLYGPESPYGHPSAGRLVDAKRVGLEDVKAFYKASFRPDTATLVVAGDITKDEVNAAIAASLHSWKAPAGPKATVVGPTAPLPAAPRLVLVDRPEAPQSVIAVVRDGVSASDPRAPLLDMINTAVGGSFTSRLNQNLREEHGWSYGVRSAFGEARGTGSFIARASVVTTATGPALREMLRELEQMAASGPTAEELAKLKAQDRAELVQSYEGVGGIAHRLGSLAMLGLPPGFDVTASLARQNATQAGLAALSAAVDPKHATIVVVGPKALVVPQLAEIGLGEPVLWDPEGFPAEPKAIPAKRQPIFTAPRP